ncbi:MULTISPECIES: DinB family protein [unclassified Endozoicomonas]|uniref:DinB family protein n=1 Tax=unclassified Endozoicomonas TaxID=2644528 RepID=UPI002147DF0C|nr:MULTISPECIES: DinB family protein [unclassified Endozoicomonas]
MTLTDARQFNISTLFELESVLRHLSVKQYKKSSSLLSSSVGTHVRHIIEFYHCFFRGLDYGAIDYDNRPRNQLLEESLEQAMEYLKNILILLTGQDMSHYPETVSVVAVIDSGSLIQTSSSIIRELLFLQNHTTHHLALIALMLTQEGVKLPVNFGVATATRLHRASTEDPSEALTDSQQP